MKLLIALFITLNISAYNLLTDPVLDIIDSYCREDEECTNDVIGCYLDDNFTVEECIEENWDVQPTPF